MRAMRATARRSGAGFKHVVRVGAHSLTVDEPRESGGDDEGPEPQEVLVASLASCTAATMEMYAARKGWDIGEIEVEASSTQGERGGPTHFDVILRLPSNLSEEQVERLKAIAAKCPVHRTLAGEVTFNEHVELTA
jgi:putative redox protein